METDENGKEHKIEQRASISGVTVMSPTEPYRITGKITYFNTGLRAVISEDIRSRTAPWIEFSGDYDPHTRTGVFTLEVWYGDDK